MPEGWLIPEGRAIAVRPATLGLPLGYAALLIVVSLQLTFTLKLWGAGIFCALAGYTIGKLLTGRDPFAWELFVASMKTPRSLQP